MPMPVMVSGPGPVPVPQPPQPQPARASRKSKALDICDPTTGKPIDVEAGITLSQYFLSAAISLLCRPFCFLRSSRFLYRSRIVLTSTVLLDGCQLRPLPSKPSSSMCPKQFRSCGNVMLFPSPLQGSYFVCSSSCVRVLLRDDTCWFFRAIRRCCLTKPLLLWQSFIVARCQQGRR